MHMNVSNPEFEKSTIGVHMKSLNYTTGMFGKFLNPAGMTLYCKGDHLSPLPGFDTWLAMCNDNRYFENEFNRNGTLYKTKDNPEDYLTSVIGNATVDFVEASLKKGGPFFAFVAPHAPHKPATPAPWYEHEFADYKAPRTKNYNFSALDHHYVIRSQQPLNSTVAQDVDVLFQNRWRTLLSVDDITIALVDLLQKYEELNNTFFIWTSDNGFQLGQFRLPMGKLQPYEFDIRVPFFIRGPGIQPNTTLSFVAAMVDVAPTIMSLAGGTEEAEKAMDGRSFAGLVLSSADSSRTQKAAKWKDKIMLEYWDLGFVLRFDHYIDMPNDTYIGARLLNESHNFLYTEFYDKARTTVFNHPLEYELFDISKDPFQMRNLYGTGEEDKNLVQELHNFIHWQVYCKGQEQCHLHSVP